jgi:2-oxo-4-hydroxy-4-carboxy-5-ureidoimidazoline decarboxylase
MPATSALWARVSDPREGRSGEDILQALERRLKNTDAQEVQAALEQLREITLLRLEGVIGE